MTLATRLLIPVASLLCRGWIRLQQKHYEQAQQQLMRAIELADAENLQATGAASCFPHCDEGGCYLSAAFDTAVYRHWLGRVHWECHRWNDARTLFLQSAKANPNYSYNFAFLGLYSLQRDNDVEKGIMRLAQLPIVLLRSTDCCSGVVVGDNSKTLLPKGHVSESH
jgi:tetratricopeptide (TPR) repeat protein